MIATNLQTAFDRAIANIQEKPVPRAKLPIFQRPGGMNKDQAVNEAASALAALWKMKQAESPEP